MKYISVMCFSNKRYNFKINWAPAISIYDSLGNKIYTKQIVQENILKIHTSATQTVISDVN